MAANSAYASRCYKNQSQKMMHVHVSRNIIAISLPAATHPMLAFACRCEAAALARLRTGAPQRNI